MLQGIHDVFHVSLLRAFDDNGLYAANPPVAVEGEEEFEVASIKEQLEHASNLLDEYKQKAAL